SQKTAVVQLQAGESQTVTVAEGQAIVLGSAGVVQSMTVNADGALVVQTSDGGSMVIANFSAVQGMANSPTLTLPGGQSLVLSAFQPATFMAPQTGQAD